MAKSADPFERGVLDGFEAGTGSPPVDQLSFAEAVDRLDQGVVVALADAADQLIDTGLREALSVFDRHVLCR
jgi:hypothetical protein